MGTRAHGDLLHPGLERSTEVRCIRHTEIDHLTKFIAHRWVLEEKVEAILVAGKTATVGPQ